MSAHDHWIQVILRDGLLLLEAEGAYTRYGWPLSVTILRRGDRFRIEWMQHGDGMSRLVQGTEDVNRAGLEDYLDTLCADDRPVVTVGGGA